jgi:hypothetical protein
MGSREQSLVLMVVGGTLLPAIASAENPGAFQGLGCLGGQDQS